jgi:hypothetical protein
MDNEKQLETREDLTQSQSGPDQTRRRLTGSALGVSAIFTLASRPVWAGGESTQCTVSGMQSGNLSGHGAKITCQGCTPGYWKVCQHLGSWGPTGFSVNQTFNNVFGVTEYVDCKGAPYTLLDVLYLNGGQRSCPSGNQDAHPNFSGCTNNGDIYSGGLGGDPISTNLGFQAVAALLSAGSPSVNYGYTAGDIITMFKNNYKTNGAALKDTFDMLNNRGCPLS